MKKRVFARMYVCMKGIKMKYKSSSVKLIDRMATNSPNCSTHPELMLKDYLLFLLCTNNIMFVMKLVTELLRLISNISTLNSRLH